MNSKHCDWTETTEALELKLQAGHSPRAGIMLIVDPSTKMVLGVSRRDDPNDFGLPGGKAYCEDATLTCAIRETREETGLIVSREGLIAVYCATDGEYITTTYVARYWAGEPMQCEPGIVVMWRKPETLLLGVFGNYNARLFTKIAFGGLALF